ncbi:MAG: zinc ribbon domain-containing protein [Pirellula sp.]|jgi:putative FmdB family regulatory protein|nr:zinc ribbon domain-containing protein [Pirellula sp.]
MPTYDYECDACGHRFELFQSISADPERKCPACKKLKLRRLIGTGAAVVFKGSGFYQTDYRSDSYKKSAAADSGSSSSGSSSTEKPSSEKTPSEKPASKSSEVPAPKKNSKKKD